MNGAHSSSPEAGAEQQYFAFIRAGQWKIQRCLSCSRHVFYPRQYCPHCHKDSFEWVAPKGGGTVYSLTQVASRDGDGPVVLLVDLDEGVRVMGGACVDDMAHIRIGSRVTGGLAAGDEQGYIMFEPEHPAHDI